MSARGKDDRKRRPYARPEVKSERFAERRALACPKHLGVNNPFEGCLSGAGYNS